MAIVIPTLAIVLQAHEVLHGFEGKRVVNIYDISEKTYLIKFVGSGDSEKSFLMLESGVRFHKTKYVQTQPQLPSPFAMILRKYLRTKRLEKVDQLAMDRVVDFKFGSGENANHIILELYASGNLVLTDSNYEVLALLRSHQFADEQMLKVGEIYPIACTINLTSLTGGATEVTELQTAIEVTFWLRRLGDRIKEEQASHAEAAEAVKNKKKKAGGETALYLRQVLLHKTCPLSFLGPDIIDHCLLTAGLDINMKMNMFETKASTESAMLFVEAVKDVTSNLLSKLEQGGRGYIVLQSTTGKDESKVMDEFTPILFKQHDKKHSTEFTSFWEAVDEYFNAIDKQRAEKEQLSRITAAEKKLEKVRKDQQRAIDTLVQHQAYLQNCAMLLEMHAEEVDKVRLVINSALASDMSWPDIEAMVEAEQKKGNPLACRISRLQLDDGKIFLKYASKEVHKDFDSSEDEGMVAKTSRASDFIEVEVDLTITSYANAAKIYSNKKVTQVKEVKTVTASEKVLHAAEEQMKKVVSNKPKSPPGSKLVRSVHWFEKFNWFVTSEGFMAVSGHDLQQTELIIRKYMRSDDIMVHADIRGAFPWVVFSKQTKEIDESMLVKVSPLAIQEVGMAVVCRSSAWSAKQLVSAYWVKADQVSKQDNTSFTVPIGMFVVNGKKHFLPPMPLEMGFGIMFRLDDESAKRHSTDRKMRVYDELESVTSTVMDRFEKYNINFEDEGLEAVQEEQDEEDKEKVQDEGMLEPETVETIPADSGIECNMALETIVSDEKRENAVVPEEKEWKQDSDYCEEDKASMQLAPGRRNKSRVESHERSSSPTSTIQSNANRHKKKPLNKKKARRYAEQDEEDVELAMMVLGHASRKSGKTMHDLKEEKSEQKKKQDLKAKQSKAGVNLIKGDWVQILQKLSPEVRLEIEELISTSVIEEGCIDLDLLKDLALFPADVAIAVIHEFRDSKNLSKVVNKSNLFAGIMRTSKKNMSKNKALAVIKPDASLVSDLELADGIDENDEDQILNRNEGDFLTEAPLPEDTLLFALPVCGPYMSMQRFKYKVKLTPGTLKKGKAVKQVLELLPRVKETTETERSKINGITENEMLLAMVGDVKLAAPGLHQQLKHKKQRGQKS
ncbi:DUF814 domain-containing protein [archaeon]|nr:MAG: DUF814 domain-containing protein [archaeon]